MGCSSTKESIDSSNEFRKFTTSRRFTSFSFDNMHSFIESNARLYAMLSINLNISEDKCKEIATRVAFELSKTHCSAKNLDPCKLFSIYIL
jgi:hypothetical protein